MISKNELFELVNKENFIDYLRNSQYKTLEMEFGKDFADMRGFSQNNPHHCFDLFEHTLTAFSNLDLEGLNPNDGFCLKIATLYHDVGKIYSAKEKDGKTVFYGHAAKSRKIALPVLREMGFEPPYPEYIGFFIEHHDDFINYRLPQEVEKNEHYIEINQENIIKYFKKLSAKSKNEGKYCPRWEDILMLCRLGWADASAQAEIVMSKNGTVIDTKENKQKRQILVAETVKSIISKS